MESVPLRQSLDHLIATFTDGVLRALANSSVAQWEAPTPSVAKRNAQRPTTKLEPKTERKAAAKIAPKTAPKTAPVAAKARVGTSASTSSPTRTSSSITTRPAPARREPIAADAVAIERALLSALKSAPILAQADLLDAAGIGAEVSAFAEQVISALLASGVLGSAAMGGTPLLFAKSKARPVGRPRGSRNETRPRAASTITTGLVETAPEATEGSSTSEAKPQAPAAEPWRPTVIRRKKATIEAADVNDPKLATTPTH